MQCKSTAMPLYMVKNVTYSSISNAENMIFFISLDFDTEFISWRQNSLVCKRQESDFIQSIGGVWNQFSQVNFFVSVQWIDNQFHHSIDFSLKLMFFSLFTDLFQFGYGQSINFDSFFLAFNNFIISPGIKP